MAFDSLFTGISGINAYQNQIDMISNDIANVGTIGFKGQRMTFADLFYQTQAFASSPNQTRGGINPEEVGVGVRVNSIDTNYSQGGLETTGINTDLAINGDGFFALRNVDGSSGLTFTRDGAFSLNSNGLLYDPASGLAVQGYMANSLGKIISNGAPGNVTIPLGLQSQAVGTGFGNKLGPTGDQAFDVALGGNVDQTQWQVEEQGIIGGQGPGQGVPDTISTTVYDSLGNAHQMFIKYVPDATGATPATIASAGAGGTVSGVSVAAGAAAQTITVTSNGAGNGYSIVDGNGNSMTGTAGQQVTFDNATFTLSSPETAAGSSNTLTITGATTGLPSSVNDAHGTAHTPATRWKTEVYFTDGTAVNGSTPTASNPTTIGYEYYDQNGQFINTSSSLGTAGAALTANVHRVGNPSSVADGNQLNITAWGLLNGNVASPTGSGSGPAATGPIGLDFSNSTSLAGTSSTSATASTTGYTATVLAQNGYEAGILSNISIGQDGSIQGAFTNGQNKILGQVVLATFQNEDGLSRIGSNQFQESANSGLAQLGTANQGRFGAIIAGALEQSNVSLADEFTKMIVAQRAFEANTRGISTADQNLQTVINIRASEN